MHTVLAADIVLLDVAHALLGVVCVGLFVPVLIAVWQDVRERRRQRVVIPDGWPPFEAPASACGLHSARRDPPRPPARLSA